MDYSFVPSTARIALYDDMLSSPRIVEVPPAETMDFIGALSSEIYNQSRQMGGSIPFSAIRQVTENFIHADFREIVVSVMDEGNTIRFTDQGPGIPDKQRAQLPGFSSATEQMKRYIDGVGSGLPIVREYLDVKHGTLTLDDNLNGGSVVTLSLVDQAPTTAPASSASLTNSAPSDDRDQYVSRETFVGTAGSRSNLRSVATSQSSNPSETVRIPAYAESGRYIGHPGNIGHIEPVEHAGQLNHEYPTELITASLSKRGRQILTLFSQQDMLGVQDISAITEIPLSSTHSELRKLEEAGLIEKIGKKRIATDLGREVARAL